MVLDEINYCCGYNWLTGEEICNFIRECKPVWQHLVLTGRNAAPELLELADTATEMAKIKHAFDQGVLAEQGVEF